MFNKICLILGCIWLYSWLIHVYIHEQWLVVRVSKYFWKFKLFWKCKLRALGCMISECTGKKKGASSKIYICRHSSGFGYREAVNMKVKEAWVCIACWRTFPFPNKPKIVWKIRCKLVLHHRIEPNKYIIVLVCGVFTMKMLTLMVLEMKNSLCILFIFCHLCHSLVDQIHCSA